MNCYLSSFSHYYSLMPSNKIINVATANQILLISSKQSLLPSIDINQAFGLQQQRVIYKDQRFMLSVKVVITLLLLYPTFIMKQLSRDYQGLIKLWRSKVSTSFVYSSQEFSHPQEMCGLSECKFYYFLYQNKEIAKQKDRNLTVLLVSGMNGQDILGPSVLLQAYKKIDAARIIYFPFANPSGFMKNTSTTFPSSWDVQNDFPIKQNSNCGKTSAYKILNKLYLQYEIDMTIHVNDYIPIISYSWSQLYNYDNSNTEDSGICLDISQMVRFQANDQIKAANLHQINTKSFGNFIDWAYGATKYKEILSRNCGEEVTKGYSQYKMNGLVFLLGVGKWSLNQSSDSEESQINKGVNIINKMVKITNPSLSLESEGQRIKFILSGCKAGSVKSVQILSQKDELIFQRTSQILIKGDVVYGPPPVISVPIPPVVVIKKDYKYKIDYQCDNGWVNLGKTVFSRMRQFRQNGMIIMKLDGPQKNFTKQHEAKASSNQNKVESSNNEWGTFTKIGLALLVIFVSVWIINGIRLTFKIQKRIKIKNFSEKFENVQFIEDNQQFANHFGKEQEKPELIEIKQMQQQETIKLA